MACPILGFWVPSFQCMLPQSQVFSPLLGHQFWSVLEEFQGLLALWPSSQQPQFRNFFWTALAPHLSNNWAARMEDYYNPSMAWGRAQHHVLCIGRVHMVSVSWCGQLPAVRRSMASPPSSHRSLPRRPLSCKRARVSTQCGREKCGSLRQSVSIKSNHLSAKTQSQNQQISTSNMDIANQSGVSPCHKFEIQRRHYLIVELLTCYFQDICFQKELDPSKSLSI